MNSPLLSRMPAGHAPKTNRHPLASIPPVWLQLTGWRRCAYGRVSLYVGASQAAGAHDDTNLPFDETDRPNPTRSEAALGVTGTTGRCPMRLMAHGGRIAYSPWRFARLG